MTDVAREGAREFGLAHGKSGSLHWLGKWRHSCGRQRCPPVVVVWSPL